MKILHMIAMGLGILVMQAALAHTELTATIPKNEDIIAKAPEDVKLSFSEPVRLTALTVQLDGAQKQSLGPLPSATTKDFTVALPALADGHYVVTWRALSEDTHVMNGEFMFAVGAAGTQDAHSAH